MVRASELTNRRELRALCDGDTLNRGTQQVWVSLHPYPDQGEGSFSEFANFPEVPGMGDLSTCLMLMVTIELQELHRYAPYLYTQWRLKQQPGFSTEIA